MKYKIEECGKYSGGAMRRWLRVIDENNNFANIMFAAVDGGIAKASPGDFPSRVGILKKIKNGDIALDGRTYDVQVIWPGWKCRGGGQWTTNTWQKNRWDIGGENECYVSRGTSACFAYALKLLREHLSRCPAEAGKDCSQLYKD